MTEDQKEVRKRTMKILLALQEKPALLYDLLFLAASFDVVGPWVAPGYKDSKNDERAEMVRYFPDGTIAASVEEVIEKRKWGDKERSSRLFCWDVDPNGDREYGQDGTMQDAKDEADREMEGRSYILSDIDASGGMEPIVPEKPSLGMLDKWLSVNPHHHTRLFQGGVEAEVACVGIHQWHWQGGEEEGTKMTEALAKAEADEALVAAGWELPDG